MKNYECKFGKRPHLLNNPIELPCRAMACGICVIEGMDYFKELLCKSCGLKHRIDEYFFFSKKAYQLFRNYNFNPKEIVHDYNRRLQKSIFNMKGPYFFKYFFK